MMSIGQIALKSVRYYKKQAFYQVIIIFLLCAVITGSLLTGNSVRTSLKKSALSRLGNTGIIASSGNRFIDPSFPSKLKEKQQINCTGLLELRGSITNLASQNASNNVSIFGVEKDFFAFHGNASVKIDSGQILVNKRLADHLNLKEGDDIIVRFPAPSDIPGDAPFSPSSGQNISIVLKTGAIQDKEDNGNFSLSINQVVPENVFINLSDLQQITGKKMKINRLLFDRSDNNINQVSDALKSDLDPEDIGLTLRYINALQSYELISDRIFIDSVMIQKIRESIPSASPVITYLANSIRSKKGSTPYSFVSAVPQNIYPDVPSGNRIIINKWLSEDIDVQPGDSVKLSWFAPDSLNQLVERDRFFVVDKVVGVYGIWADSTLMPEFPGIAGKESCSGWDAGVQIRMNQIRDKDEAYWREFRGTPKAFISFETGKEMWGNNFGPATSIRFPEGITPAEIHKKLAGTLEPGTAGISLTDIYHESINAADESVDFGTLFLGLGFFLILAAIVLLSFTVSSFFEIRKPHVYTLFALGFKNRSVKRMLLTESILTSIASCIPGSIAGYLVNVFLTAALNSVWRGAVQTNTLTSHFYIIPVITGCIVSLITVTGLSYLMAGRYLNRLKRAEAKNPESASPVKNIIFLIISFLTALLSFILSINNIHQQILFSFISGASLLFTLLLSWRHYYITAGRKAGKGLSTLYYSFYPSNALAPIAFIAAGIFAFFITVVNRKDFDLVQNEKSSGTGGYLLWSETVIPVREDLNIASAKIKFGLDEDSLVGLSFVQMKRSPGNDASCLNLNHITAPPLLGADPENFIADGRFSFAKVLKKEKNQNPWSLLNERPDRNAFYGIADQTVLEWGLKISVGDTLMMRAENGQPVSIIIAAGLQSSVFQGYILISKKYFTEIYPSVSGSTVMLADGIPSLINVYSNTLKDRFGTYGIDVIKTSDRLATFYEITNTYLSVFGVFGGLGMITGIAGLGFVLLRNYNQRRREFGLMLATGYSFRKIRKMVFSEQLLILSAGVISGVSAAIIATLPSLKNNHEISWAYLALTILLIFLTGLAAILISLRSIKESSLVEVLRRE